MGKGGMIRSCPTTTKLDQITKQMILENGKTIESRDLEFVHKLGAVHVLKGFDGVALM